MADFRTHPPSPLPFALAGVAIGGDRYPGSNFLDHMLRYQANPNVKMLVLLGEVGGTDEYDICAAMKDGRITKPIVAWCIGTCAKVRDSIR
jgi:ATP citrate (pro-S)-lyase